MEVGEKRWTLLRSQKPISRFRNRIFFFRKCTSEELRNLCELPKRRVVLVIFLQSFIKSKCVCTAIFGCVGHFEELVFVILWKSHKSTILEKMDGISQMWQDQNFSSSCPASCGSKSKLMSITPLFREVWKNADNFWDAKANFAVHISDFFPEVHIRGAAEFLRASKEESC